MDFEIFILVFLLIFNIVMWIVFGVKFKKIFNTDELLKKTRDELNFMLTDINTNAERNIQLIDGKISELKKISEEAEKNVRILRSEIDKTEKSTAFKKKIDTLNSKNDDTMEREFNLMRRIQLSDKAVAEVQKKNENVDLQQLDLFQEQELKPEENSVASENPSENVESEEKTADIPEFYKAENQIEIKKGFNDLVKEYKSLGYTVEEIADMTSRSVQEVKLVLALS